MSVALVVSLLIACGVLMLIERTGVRTTLDLHFKGDLKRETRWFAQYGQAACTPVAFLLVWDLEPPNLDGRLAHIEVTIDDVDGRTASAEVDVTLVDPPDETER